MQKPKVSTEDIIHATLIAFDILHGMLTQACNNCKDIATDVFHVQADTFALQPANQSIDLLLAQNTIPCFEEFSMICRPAVNAQMG